MSKGDELIIKDPEIQFGEPTIKGTRICVSVISGMIESGDAVSFIAKEYDISEAQVLACVNYNDLKSK